MRNYGLVLTVMAALLLLNMTQVHFAGAQYFTVGPNPSQGQQVAVNFLPLTNYCNSQPPNGPCLNYAIEITLPGATPTSPNTLMNSGEYCPTGMDGSTHGTNCVFEIGYNGTIESTAGIGCPGGSHCYTSMTAYLGTGVTPGTYKAWGYIASSGTNPNYGSPVASTTFTISAPPSAPQGSINPCPNAPSSISAGGQTCILFQVGSSTSPSEYMNAIDPNNDCGAFATGSPSGVEPSGQDCNMYVVYVPPGGLAPNPTTAFNLYIHNDNCNWYDQVNTSFSTGVGGNATGGDCIFTPWQFVGNGGSPSGGNVDTLCFGLQDVGTPPTPEWFISQNSQNIAYCNMYLYIPDITTVSTGSGTYYAYFTWNPGTPYQIGVDSVDVSSGPFGGTMQVTPGDQFPPGTSITVSGTLNAGTSSFITFPSYEQNYCWGTWSGTRPANCWVMEYTPNSTTEPCEPPQVLVNQSNWCPNTVTNVSKGGSRCVFPSDNPGGSVNNLQMGYFSGPGTDQPNFPPQATFTSTPITVDGLMSSAMLCMYYSPDSGAGRSNNANSGMVPFPGVYVNVQNFSLSTAPGSGINGGINLVVPTPVQPNTVVDVSASPTVGCSYNGGVTCDPYDLEIAGAGLSCANPSTLTTCPAFDTLGQLEKNSPSGFQCLLSQGNTGPQINYPINTTNTTNGDTFSFCSYMPQVQASSESQMAISTTGGGGTGPGCGIQCGGFGSGGGPPPVNISAATNAICNVYFVINTVLFILALTIMIIGGAVYAGANVLPGSTRGAIQGYAMGMIMGGIVGALIAVVAPWILSTILSQNVYNIVSSVC